MFSKPQHANTNSIKFYGVDSAILSSIHARAVMVKKMHENDVHDILPVLYEVASIPATIPATSCSAEKSFNALSCIMTFLRSTMRHHSKTYTGIYGLRINRSSQFFYSLILHLSLSSCFCRFEILISIYRKYLHYFDH